MPNSYLDAEPESEPQRQPEPQQRYAPPAAGRSPLATVALIVGILYVLGSGYLLFNMHNKLEKLESAEKASTESAELHNSAIMKRLGMTEASLKESAASLQSKLGQANARAAALAREQQQAEQQIAESQKQLSSVSGELGGVRTDLTGAKGDIANTRTDLESTKSRLDHAIGDLGEQSGLIAHTRDELEVLKHRGDRNYYEFTLGKGKKPQPVSTVSLQLKKVDAKKGRFTLNVIADDRTIEKKDRTLNEPLQFYTGRDHNLYEVVVFTAAKNQISGYLSTPKNAPTPVVNR